MLLPTTIRDSARPYLDEIQQKIDLHRSIAEQAELIDHDDAGPVLVHMCTSRLHNMIATQRRAIHYAEQAQAACTAALTAATNQMVDMDQVPILEAAKSILEKTQVEDPEVQQWRDTLVEMRFYPILRARQAAQTLRVAVFQMDDSANELQNVLSNCQQQPSMAH